MIEKKLFVRTLEEIKKNWKIQSCLADLLEASGAMVDGYPLCGIEDAAVDLLCAGMSDKDDDIVFWLYDCDGGKISTECENVGGVQYPVDTAEDLWEMLCAKYRARHCIGLADWPSGCADDVQLG